MPAPPPESEPAMVTAIGVIAPSRTPLADRAVDDRAQLAGGGLRVGLERKRRDHRATIGAGIDDRSGVAGVDTGDAAHRKARLALAERCGDARESLGADRPAGVVLGRGREHAADPDVVD